MANQSDQTKINDYPEKIIRNIILIKVKPGRINKKGKHWKGYVYLGKKLITKVKIPNNHPTIMRHSKSQYIASALKLDNQGFNNLIECPLTGPKYYKYLEQLEKYRE